MYRYFLALRYLLSRPINLLGVIGVTLGVWALILVVSIFSGFLKVFRAHVQSATSHVSVLLIPEHLGYETTASVLREIDAVAATAPRVVWHALLHGGRKQRTPSKRMTPGADVPFVTLLGIDPGQEAAVTGLRQWVSAIDPQREPHLRVTDPDDPLRPMDGRPAILLGRDRMLTYGLARGDVVRMTTVQPNPAALDRSRELKNREFVVGGAFATEHIGFDGLHVLVSIDEVRELLRDGAPPVDYVTEIPVRLTDPARSAEVVERIKRLFAERFGFNRPFAMTWEELNINLLQAVDHQRSLMKLVLFVILVVAAFLMYATLSMMVTEKTRDIGILTALGGRPAGVLQVFLFCGLAISVCGTVLGVLAGCLSSVYLDAFNSWMREAFGIDLFPPGVYNLAHVPYDLDPWWIAQVCGMALGAGLLVSGLPALRAARHSPLQSLRNE